MDRNNSAVLVLGKRPSFKYVIDQGDKANSSDPDLANMLLPKRGSNDRAFSEGDAAINCNLSAGSVPKQRPRSSIGHVSEVGRKMLKVFLSNHRLSDEAGQNQGQESKKINPRLLLRKVKSMPSLQVQNQGHVNKEVMMYNAATTRHRRKKHGSLPDLKGLSVNAP